MAKDLIFEIGVEEMPAAAVKSGIAQLGEKAAKLLEQNRLDCESLETFGTPRRLVLWVEGVAEKQTDTTQEIKGPAKKVAYSDHGEPTMAAIGFAQAQGVKVEELVVKKGENGEYVYAVKKAAGQPTPQLLPGLFLELLKSFSFQKAMRWSDGDFRFVRPVRWLLALYGDRTIDFTIDGLTSGNLTCGHRFLGRPLLKVKSAADYFKMIEEGKILVDQRKRASLIEREIQRVAHKAGGRAIIDPAVFEEVVDLVEYPGVLLGSFPADYLSVPKDVLISAMKSHQRYFPVEDAQGNLLSHFIVVHNGDPSNSDLIRRGHERVLKARLADARFFFEEDRKEKLEQNVEKLKGVIFQSRLGTLYEKTKRLETLVQTIGKMRETGKETLAVAHRAAHLSHADLVSKMVVEFPALQGVMGREYASLAGEQAEVARAIFERYLPRFAGDALPETEAGQLLSLADKLDTIVTVALKDWKRLELPADAARHELNLPTGSEDPFALRRQATGIIRVLIEKNIALSLRKLLHQTYLVIHQVQGIPVSWKVVEKHYIPQLLVFFSDRLDRYWSTQGISYDTAEAILALLIDGTDDLVDLDRRVKTLTAFRATPSFDDLIIAFNRCNNLSKTTLGIAVKPELLQEKEEKELHRALIETSDRVNQLLAVGDYAGALETASYLRLVVDRFFDLVLVMVDDKVIQENRVRLLNYAVDLFGRLADFSRLVIPAENESR